MDIYPEELIEKALAASGRACLTCSFQAEDMVVLHMARHIAPKIPVLFLETGYHFAETYAYRDKMTAAWDLNLVNLMPKSTVAEQESAFGKLYISQPSECCNRRKVEPLFRGLSDYDIWFTGLRREQSPTRANLKQEEAHRLPDGREIRKISPLAAWTMKDVWAYLTVHEIEPLPLYEQGYLSIGCEPCTALPADANNPRSGRWGGVKLECGIHTFSERRSS